jgi:hypothetical protein
MRAIKPSDTKSGAKNAPSNMTDTKLKKIAQLQMKKCLEREAVICMAIGPNVRPSKMPDKKNIHSQFVILPCALGSVTPSMGIIRSDMIKASV